MGFSLRAGRSRMIIDSEDLLEYWAQLRFVVPRKALSSAFLGITEFHTIARGNLLVWAFWDREDKSHDLIITLSSNKKPQVTQAQQELLAVVESVNGNLGNADQVRLNKA